MFRRVLLLSAVAVLATQAADFKLGAHTFTVPDGFEIDVVAGPPLVDRPITVAFDETGALYVADSSGSNEKVQKQLEDKPHRILRLVDRDGDGRFDTRTVFVDRVSFPEGTMWLDGSLYVSAPPQIWKFSDRDGDGTAEQREVWFDGKTLTNCANDLHGPYPGPDGYIYWCKGAFAEQQHKLADGTPLTTRASHLFRARPDGSGLESVITGGMDNPVDVVFTPSGERLLSATFLVHPSGGQRDGIIHAVTGGVWGKDHAVLDGHRRTGELMPVLAHLGAAAPSGLEIRRAANWGAEWQGQVFACQFNLRKVSSHKLLRKGATFTTAGVDFVVSDQADFHPTDVVETPDGSMLIVDTGGWYKLCCPTSQLHKPDVLGAIYRVRKKDAALLDPADKPIDWAKAAPVELAKLLGDANPFLRDRAIATLAKAGESAVSPVAAWLNTTRPGASPVPVEARLSALWTLTRIPGDNARAAVRFAFADASPEVRAAASHSAGLWRDRGAVEALINQLRHDDLHLRRAAVEALGRMGEKQTASAILGALSGKGANDRFLEHSCAHALMELRAVEIARAALAPARADASASRVAAITLHGLKALQPQELLPLLSSPDAATQVSAQWIASQHPEWGETLANWVEARIAKVTAAEFPRLQSLLGQLASNVAIQSVLGEIAQRFDAGDDEASRDQKLRLLFGAMGASGLKEIPNSWLPALAVALAERGTTTAAAIQAIRPFASRKSFPSDLRAALEQLANDSDAGPALRVAALSALPVDAVKLSPGTFDLLQSETRSGDLLRARDAAQLLGRAKLPSAQLASIAQSLPEVPAGVVASLLEAFRHRRDAESGRLLLAHLSKLKSPPAPVIRSVLAAYPEEIRSAADALLANAAPPNAKARLDELASLIPQGDARRGHLLFQSPRSACATCHAMAYTGGTLGPDLTKIGATRSERDLLEAIIYPSLSFVRSYEPMLVTTRSGESHLGVVKKEDAEEVILATAPGTETRLARAEIRSIEPAPASLMPPGYDGIFTPQELADLAAFLKAAR